MSAMEQDLMRMMTAVNFAMGKDGISITKG